MGSDSLLQGDFSTMLGATPRAGGHAARSTSTFHVAVVDGEYNPALLCVSAPVFDEEGTSVASLTVALLSAQVTDERIEKMKKHVRNIAQNLSKERGYFEDRFPEAALAS